MKTINKFKFVRTIVVFVFMSLTFSIGVSAQNNGDDPMGDKAAAALVKELDGVVKRLSPDKNEARLASEKWYKRKNLGKKTKNEVIELLYEDVKSVIKDSGTQYQIYSTFSFYKNVDLDVESILIDSFRYANREDMMLRIDNFTVDLQNNSSAKGYIVIKGKKPARIAAEKEINNYLKMRAFEMKNIVFVNGDGDKTTEIELWRVPRGAKPPAIEEKSKNKPQAMLIDSFRYANREDMMLRIDNFTVQMQNDSLAKGYIAIKGKKTDRIAAEKEIKDYLKMRAFDMKAFVFLNGDGDKTTEIELSLVPPGAKPPKIEKKNENKPQATVAQTKTDKPMEAKALADLVEELKGVISRVSPDKNEAKLVGEKWDARKDLNGKTRSEAIELLFEDVKSVIKDSGTQYQIYSMFSFYKAVSDDSPTDKPLETEALANLVKELRGVITQSIFISKEEANLIGQKWNARKYLAGKTKKDVIQILFDDVRSVIKDFDTRTQIFTMFSFYEAIPDDSLTEQPIKQLSKMSKAELVDGLVAQTLRMNSYYSTPEYPMTPEEKKASDILEKKDRIETYEEALKENDKLTPKQKDFVRANYDKLLKMEDKMDSAAEKKSTERSLNHLVEESLQKSYTKFAVEELTSLIASFNGIKGQKHLDSINRLVFAQGFFGDIEELGYPKDEIAEYKKFADSELGKKFLTAYFVETEAYFKSRNEAEKLKNPDDDRSLGFHQELNKLINKFIEKYDKGIEKK